LGRRRASGRAIARTPEPKPEKKKPSGRRTAIIITAVFLVVIAISIVTGYYFLVWKDLWRPILRVNDETISMDYLIRRMKYPEKTHDIEGMLMVITQEEFIRQEAPNYSIEVTPDEIDERLRDVARGDNETISESEFKKWYRDQLNETQLSDAEYRELVGTYMLAERLNDYLTAGVPAAAEQVHLYAIFLASPEDAEAALARIEAGEDFSELARELSFDTGSAEQGGDIGWWPRLGGLPENLEYNVFDELEVGQVSGVIGVDPDNQIYAICLVAERQPDREIEADKLETIKSVIFQEWLNNALDTVDHQIIDYDNETMAWIDWKIEQD
jgi:nitrate reductase NapE component